MRGYDTSSYDNSSAGLKRNVKFKKLNNINLKHNGNSVTWSV